ncbi:hypothetical protein OPFLODJI_10001 (plasmid) [Aeromonas hydrophila]
MPVFAGYHAQCYALLLLQSTIVDAQTKDISPKD